jgi:thiamine-phosphate diphosphorylase
MHTYMITGQGRAADIVNQVARALDAGVDRVQLRRKGAPAAELEALVEAIAGRRGRECRTRLLVNDRLDVALAHELAGVHLPADGLDARAVRRVTSPGFEIGVSVHDVDAALEAARDGADFLAFGPVFPTASKPGHPGVGLERLKEVVRAVSVPVYALGGITPANAPEVAACGAFGVAGISVFANEPALKDLLGCG